MALARDACCGTLEFVQFHPTALLSARTLALTEALRGGRRAAYSGGGD
jgi:aspartate oxidase